MLHEGRLVVLESTTYPGTTRERLQPILEESGLAAGRDFNLAFSPERIDPGRTDYTMRTTPKVVGGLTDACTERAAELYGRDLRRGRPRLGPRAAELAKLLENIFRSVNIALVNELAMLCDRMGIDIWEVIDAASTKPFGFMRFDPGPGMGGHCLPVDPFYLTFKAREHDFYTEFIELAGKVNQNQPRYCVERIEQALNDVRKPLRGSRVLLLGVAYKAGGRRPARVAGAEDHQAAARARRRGRPTTTPTSPSSPSWASDGVDLDAELARCDIACVVTAHRGRLRACRRRGARSCSTSAARRGASTPPTSSVSRALAPADRRAIIRTSRVFGPGKIPAGGMTA